eukprot:TRINITY_DN25832_c0_g1_i1.p1 TRINITY_DN25832_c0_g1~~TRINITY_DN25832_c0_g1_i1.p1  ORF type:complete len:274 (+),score=24.95 TRINITY_DN25832_c0_g1_i1:30-824(+)
MASHCAAALAVDFSPHEFVSGGQVGADSAPFSVYEDLGVALRGYMPKGFERADGRGREIAARYGLAEGQGGYKWRDMRNAESADACLAFLTTLPLTGRGTMQTVNMFVDGRYEHVQLDKPSEQDYVVYEPALVDDSNVTGECTRNQRSIANKPVIVFWNICEGKLEEFAHELQTFLRRHRPRSLMLSGPLERTWPGIELLGAELLRRALRTDSQSPRGPPLPADTSEISQERAVPVRRDPGQGGRKSPSASVSTCAEEGAGPAS